MVGTWARIVVGTWARIVVGTWARIVVGTWARIPVAQRLGLAAAVRRSEPRRWDRQRET